MKPKDPLLQAVLDDPDDDAPRLVYADWLQERGRPGDEDRAEFIRLQVQLAGMEPGDPKRRALEKREEALRNVHETAWRGELPKWAWDVAFRRGFAEKVSATARQFLKGASGLFRRAPIQSASLHNVLDEHAVALAQAPYLGKLHVLCLQGIGPERITDVGAAALAVAPGVANLTSLSLIYNAIGTPGAQALAASPHLARLTSLRLEGNRIGAEGVLALATTPWLSRLTDLDLDNNGIGDAGAEALFAALRPPPSLTMLTLCGNGLGAAAARALAACPHLVKLNHLSLMDNPLGDAGAEALANSPHLRNLRHLHLGRTNIGEAGGLALAASPHLGDLRDLFLNWNDVGLTATEALQKCFGVRVRL